MQQIRASRAYAATCPSCSQLVVLEDGPRGGPPQFAQPCPHASGFRWDGVVQTYFITFREVPCA